MAQILDGKAIAAQLRKEIAAHTADFIQTANIKPHLAAVIVGDDPASQVYVRNKRKACADVGFDSSLTVLPATTTQTELLQLVDKLNRDPLIHGILVQLPLPKQIDEQVILLAVDPLKDVDCFHPYNVGLLAEGHERFLPCTPAGVQEILKRSNIPLAGANVVIVGRSNLVGKPLALMLLRKGVDATVTVCHSRTRDLGDVTRKADVVIAAIGQPEFIRGAMIKPGAVVIDVGINRLPDGRLVGDVAYDEAAAVASAITPVPGGVGPMTIALLLANTLKAARLAAKQPGP